VVSSAREFVQVDVFTSEPLRGNPVAVVLDGSGLTTERMQRFAAWTNLSESTFLRPPGNPAADYAVRIFTGDRELPFAGHPTLGSCHAWLAAGGVPAGEDVVQECGAGLVRIRRDPGSGDLSFAAPTRARSGPLDDADLAAAVRGLGLRDDDVVAHQWCDNGPPWQTLMLRSAEQVLAIRPRAEDLAGRFVGVVGPHAAGDDVQYEVRAFFPTANGVGEDPVTGSLNAAVGQWLIGTGTAPPRYVAAQGTCLDRAGRVVVEQIDGQVWVGGSCTTLITGTVQL
jgi:PhzF family phenazine biosynthesis protein